MLARINWQPILAAIIASILSVFGARQFASPAAPSISAPAPLPIPENVAPEVAKNPIDAIGRLAMSGGYCSATAVTPPNAQGRQILLSAAHCVKQIGETCTFYTRSGIQLSCRVKAINRTADASLLETEPLKAAIPYIHVAASTPAKGTPIFHAGFGVDNPGNTETGEILASDNGSGQVMYSLSVSPGDSGGGICVTAAGEVLSPVCCTTHLAAKGQVFGARPEEVQKMLKQPASFLDLPPMQMPMRFPQ